MKRKYSIVDSRGELFECLAEDALAVPAHFRRAGRVVNSPLVVTVVATGERVRVFCRSGEVPKILWDKQENV